MPTRNVFDRLESNVQSYARSFPATFARASGAEIWDRDGRRYIDFLAGAGSLNYGHNNPALRQALIDYIQSDGIAHSLDMHTAAKERFLEAMEKVVLVPRGLPYVVQFTGPTGANAVEAALKIARKVTGRTNVIFFTDSFHGVSAGALAITGSGYFRRAAGVPLYGGTAMPYDGYLGDGVDTVAILDSMISDPSSGVDLPAAVIVETVQGEGGLNAASIDWLRRLQALCRKHDVLLIVDDIQAGCGRTGTFFSFEPAAITPDIVTLSKSLSGYGLPLSIVLLRRDIDRWLPGEHNGTFRGNNHAFVTAAAALHEFWSTPAFSIEAGRKGERLQCFLQILAEQYAPHITGTRGRGMMRGIRFADPRFAARVAGRAFEQGLVIERSGPQDEVVKCLMPLTISEDQMSEGLYLLGCSIAMEFGAFEAAPEQRKAG